MRIFTMLPVVGVLLSLGVAPAAAQYRPVATTTHGDDYGGVFALGASASPTITASRFLEDGIGVAATAEGYVTHRLSLRAQLGSAWWDMSGLSFNGTLHPVFLVGNLAYNFEVGAWRPYVTAGGGAYRYSFSESTIEGFDVDGHKMKSVWDAGAGTEYFFADSAAVTGEFQYHKVGLVPTNRATLGFKGSFWSVMMGAKKYF
jgi:opacity protein-like surface antigen